MVSINQLNYHEPKHGKILPNPITGIQNKLEEIV